MVTCSVVWDSSFILCMHGGSPVLNNKINVSWVYRLLNVLVFCFIHFIFSFLLVAFEAYRNKDDALNYIASGGKKK